ncbi:DegT/DnrJ/EryC1/StrS family aminotransferase [Marinobacter sp. M216]|uniref:DegT/DnrJ/EryC1/StrS family aminotransferase n=1 Tax=Marinobacter albus TaxID=3030833 RepID=A0ABT7HBD0_9GAMM|nr:MULTISPECIES: DegT/DnrJ/EryC1/StrS family aminotransferase [unclassified Marinobacter]MBW7470055.1 DegT/DnrJ/EryC1/StrS family aminotransferase [Marinobacter sp. F4218]MDK9557681.1 DegT/DnrJ/EryC1/StrS family aminotransferase [Marinobacter sp. M216]
MLGKLRPVGSRIPNPDAVSTTEKFPWHRDYRAEFTSSGTAALAMAISLAVSRKAAISPPEVIIPAYGCPDLVAAIVANGGKPVLADLIPDTGVMDESQVRGAVTSQTVAVVAAGLLGFPERLEVLAKICNDLELFLIEDSAQCFPPASTENPWADAVVVSFGRGKPINLMGGGALLVRVELEKDARDVIERFPLLKAKAGVIWRLKRRLFHLLMARYPFFVLEKLPFLNIGDTKYQECSAICRVAMSELMVLAGIDDFFSRPLTYPLYDRELKPLEQFGWKKLEGEGASVQNPRIRYGLLAPTEDVRDQACRALNSSGIGASRFYGQTLAKIEGLQDLCGSGYFPVAEDFASRLLTLPCHEDVKADDVALVARILLGLYEN